MNMPRKLTGTLLICLLLIAAVTLWMFRRGQPNPSTLNRINPGMTVQQVEDLLGKPTEVIDTSQDRPNTEMRMYNGAGGMSIWIEYKNGVVDKVDEFKHRNDWFRVG